MMTSLDTWPQTQGPEATDRLMDYTVHRKILDETSVDKMAGKSPSRIRLSDQVRKSMRCSALRVRNLLLRCVPILQWLPGYALRDNVLGDLISGLSVGVLQLPLGMSYGLLASVPPVYGLYSSFYPVLIYFIFGTSQHVSIGAYGVVGVMIGSVTDRLTQDWGDMMGDNVTNSTVGDPTLLNAQRVRVALAVSFLSGIFQIGLGLIHFGFLVSYLSEPLVGGYTTASSLHVVVSQLENTFGIKHVKHSGAMSIVYTVLEAFSKLPQANTGTLLVSAVAILSLILGKKLAALLVRWFPIPLPVEVIVLIVATVVSAQVNLEHRYGVEIVGVIPSGLQPPVLPDVSVFGQVLGDAFASSMVSYGMLISLGRIYAMKHGYKVDNNQELVALGLSNSLGALFQSLAISGSIPRTVIRENSGGRTGVAGAVSAVVVLVIVLWIGSLFEHVPKAMLAAIINVNLLGAFKQFKDIPVLWRRSQVDAVIWVATFILTLLLNPDVGLAASIGFSMLTVIVRTQLPTYSLLGQVPGTDVYRPLEEYNQVRQVPGISIFRSSSTLYFANAEMYQDALGKKCDVDFSSIQAARRTGLRRRRRGGTENQQKTGDHEMQISVIQTEAAPEPSWPRAVILDLSPVNFLDTVAIKALTNIHRGYRDIGIKVVFAGCQPAVVDNLRSGGFFEDQVSRLCVFSSIHDAMLFCQSVLMEEEGNITTSF